MVLTNQDELTPLRSVLERGGYVVGWIELEGVGGALLAETPYALVALVATSWEDLEETAAATQAALTALAAEEPSALRWDLYVVAAVPSETTPLHEATRETVENDTRYARKLVATGVSDDASATRALRALLPLDPPAEISRVEPLEAIRAGLLQEGVDPTLADAAITAFELRAEVRIP